MNTYVIVRKEDLAIMGFYEAEAKDDTSANRSYLVAEPICAHIELPEGLVADEVSAEEEEGVISLVADAAKLQAKVDKKWADMRAERDRRLTACDKVMIEDYPISSTLKDQYITYRQALRDLPESILDIDDFDYPVEPTE